MKERLNYIIGETRYKLPQDGKVINNPDIVNSCTDDLCRYLIKAIVFLYMQILMSDIFRQEKKIRRTY